MSDGSRRHNPHLISAVSLFCWWPPWICCCILSAFLTVPLADTHVMMTNSEKEPQSGGYILSPGFPQFISLGNFSRIVKPVTLRLTACRRCRIKLVFRKLSLPYCHYPDSHLLAIQTIHHCARKCSYFYIQEPHYEKTTRHIMRDSYTTSSRSVLLLFCKGSYTNNITFKIQYSLEDKTFTLPKDSNGTLHSPNYPGPYALNGDIYTYEIHSPGKYIRIIFDGWDLSLWTTIEIRYIHKNKNKSLTRHGQQPRFIGLSFEDLTVVFLAESHSHPNSVLPYLGFHAHYEFVEEESWPEVPSVVGSEYFHLIKGDYFESPSCLPGQSIDSLWVIGSPTEVGVSQVLVNFEEHHVLRWHLEIRQGVTSEGQLLYNSDSRPKQRTSSVVSPSGLYIRLKYDCQISTSFKATFAYFAQPNYNNECTNPGITFRCKYEDRCISDKLQCDGHYHCMDSTDEVNCQGPTTRPRCRSSLLYRCPSNNQRICAEDRCNGVTDCPLGSDEHNCPTTTQRPSHVDGMTHWSTIVPVILTCVIIVIMGCIAITWYMQCRHRRHLHTAPHPSGGVTRRLRTISQQLGSTSWPGMEGEGLERDAPPGYHEAVLYSPRVEAVNLGYTRTDSQEAFPKPPPYSPTLGLECIPPPSYEQINPQALTDGYASLQMPTDGYGSLQVLTDGYASLQMLTDSHASQHELTDSHANQQVLTDSHANQQVLTGSHASKQVLTDSHANHQVLTDSHTNQQLLTDNYVSPYVLTDNNTSPHVLTDCHANQQVLTNTHANQQVLTDSHANQQVLTDSHANQQVLTDSHANQQVLTDSHANQQVLTDSNGGFGGTSTLQFMENTNPDVEELNVTTV